MTTSVLLGRKFPLEYLLQIPVSFLFSYFIDMTMELLVGMNPQIYISKLLLLIMGCVILGIGVYMEMAADVVMLPGECFVSAVTRRFHTDFGKTKVCFDTSMAVGAIVLGLVLYGKLAGVREGTLISAFLVGTIARLIKKKVPVIERWLIGGEE